MKSKKLVLFLLVAAVLLMMTGCQSKESAKKETKPLLEAVKAVIQDQNNLVPYTAEDLEDMIGISPDSYAEAVFLMGSDTLSGREIIAVRAKDTDSLQNAKKALENYLEQRKDETRNYLPEAYKLQSEARVETKGLTVSLFIGASGPEESKAFLSGE